MELPVIIFGATELGKLALDIFQSHNILAYCFLDDDEDLHGKEIMDVSVMGHTKDDGFLKYIGQKCEAFIAIEDVEKRMELVELLKNRRKVMPVNAVHKTSVISAYASLGHGTLINAGTVVNTGVSIANFCSIHANTTIGVDTKIAEHVQIGAGTTIGANVLIGEGCTLGSGVIIGPGTKIGPRAQILTGSVVLRDVPEGDTVFGVPAKSI